MKAISTTALILCAAVCGFSQTPHRPLSSIFNSKLAFYLPSPDSTPISTSVVNTAGGTPTIAGNTWIEIHGTNLSQTTKVWSDEQSFKNPVPTMPLSIDGVSATVNNKPAAIYYVSPTQINALVPLDSATGPVAVKVTTNFGTTAPLNPTMQAVAPGFLVIDVAGHIAAQHLDFSLLGPASLTQPGYVFTPAKPNEQVTFYATGFGQTNPPITDELNGRGPLPTLPTITIGGLPAMVAYAGDAGPGLYQFNVIIPPSAPDGELALKATYNGASSQDGVVVAVKK